MKSWLAGGGIHLLLIAAAGVASAHAEEVSLRNVAARSSLTHAAQKFSREKTGHVAFMGGSITEMNGYRPMVCQWLEQKFPETKFTFTDAGIASTCSTTGAFRLQRDVLLHGPVDLFLVEFAVNDDQDAAHVRRDCIRGMEGVIRQLKTHNAEADVAIVYFCNEGMVAKLQAGETPISIAAHEAVAEHYGVASVNLAQEVAQRITDKTLTWKTYGGTHPAPAGNRIAADLTIALLDDAWTKAAGKPSPVVALPAPLDEKSYVRGRFVDPSTAKSD
ncbi:MAG: SGNH/GDSL hydrolase family protein, partial [Planctomycetales bacterium]|nr:SGNH/GDSL hydrolase family protein [Planctomycetales bacterium]